MESNPITPENTSAGVKHNAITRLLIKGAMYQPQDKVEYKASDFVPHPLYLPKVNFLKLPDVRIMWRSICLALLGLTFSPVVEYKSFDELCKERSISEAALLRIQGNLKRAALGSFALMGMSVLIGIWLQDTMATMGCASTFILLSVFYWKYSFLLWQVRKRSLDEDASMRNFMSTSWYLEAFK